MQENRAGFAIPEARAEAVQVAASRQPYPVLKSEGALSIFADSQFESPWPEYALTRRRYLSPCEYPACAGSCAGLDERQMNSDMVGRGVSVAHLPRTTDFQDGRAIACNLVEGATLVRLLMQLVATRPPTSEVAQPAKLRPSAASPYFCPGHKKTSGEALGRLRRHLGRTNRRERSAGYAEQTTNRGK